MPTALAYSQVEYDVSNGASSINSAAAYKAGFNGSGVTIGVVDSGIDQNQIEFTGRISPLSRDFAGNASVQDEEGHGTSVAGVLGAGANNRNTLGVAWGATILALRTDKPGSCAITTGEDKGCKHPDTAIGQAIDFARQNGAKVINISLGGGAAGSAVVNAVNRATAADIIIVISAGNDGEKPEGANPDPFAQVAFDTAVARGLVIIAGALGEDNTTLAPFSNRAGSGRTTYITALGTRVRTVNATNQAVLASGTSFAAPIVSGAVAIIRQAFPNLTGAQVVDLIYRTARDLGATGIDEVYGRGALDLTRAFQPQGSLKLAGSGVELGSLDGGQLGSAMGDGGRAQGVAATALDLYGRAYSAEVAGGARSASPSAPFAASLRAGQRTAGVRTPSGGLIALSVAGSGAAQALDLARSDAVAARATAFAFVQRLDRRTSVRLGIARGADGLAERLDRAREGAFLVAGRADRQSGLLTAPAAAAAVSHDLGPVRVTIAAESGQSLSQARSLLPSRHAGYDRDGYSALSASAETRVGPAALAIGATRMSERSAILGSRLGPAVGAGGGAGSWFLDAGAEMDLGGIQLGAQWRQGFTTPQAGGLLTGGTLRSSAWSFDVGKSGVLGDDLLSFRISQPLRVSGGGLSLLVPTGYDYATLTPDYTRRRLDLSPVGAERTAEVAYSRAVGVGRLSLNGWWRVDPGNNALIGDEQGALLRWSAGF